MRKPRTTINTYLPKRDLENIDKFIMRQHSKYIEGGTVNSSKIRELVNFLLEEAELATQIADRIDYKKTYVNKELVWS